MDAKDTTSASSPAIRMNFVGDVMIGRSFNAFLDRNPGLDIWGNTAAIMNVDSVNVINLETTITDATDPWPNKPITYKLATRHRSILDGIHPAFANIANNHILDYKDEGARSTMHILDRKGIAHAGVGEEYTDVVKPAVVERGGRTFVFLAAADYPRYWDVTIARRSNRIGVWQFDMGIKGYRDIIQQVKGARAEYGPEAVIVMSLHWGKNWVDNFEPGYMRRMFARDLIRAGVDIIHGTSSHHILPIEQMTVTVPGTSITRTGIVFYGLGEFIDDYGRKEEFRSNVGLIGRVDIPRVGPPRLLDEIYVRIQPVLDNDMQLEGMQVNIISEENDSEGDIAFFRPIVHMPFQEL